MHEVRAGAQRTEHDGCRRYLAVQFSFDTRAHVLTMPIGEDWEAEVREQWFTIRRGIRTEIIHQYGNEDHERKISDFSSMGSAPWTITDEHNVFLAQIRSAFTNGSYYPALVGACALGERILNELVRRLRGDYINHESTAKVSTANSISNWVTCIEVLVDWGVLDDSTATTFNSLRKIRNKSIHYGLHLNGADAREDSLAAIAFIQSVIQDLYAPHGGPPRFIAETEGHSYIAIDSEDEPLIRRFYLPVSVLVSPRFRMEPSLEDPRASIIFDDENYQDEFPTLTDEEYAIHLREQPRGAPDG